MEQYSGKASVVPGAPTISRRMVWVKRSIRNDGMKKSEESHEVSFKYLFGEGENEKKKHISLDSIIETVLGLSRLEHGRSTF